MDSNGNNDDSNEYDACSEHLSTPLENPSSRRNSTCSTSSLAKSRRESVANLSQQQQRRSSITDSPPDVTISSETTQQQHQQQQQKLSTTDNNPVKVLVFNGKCSDIFKQTLEDVVQDCILEFPGENSVYVTKTGHAIQIPKSTIGSSSTYSLRFGDNSNDSLPKQKKSNFDRRRNSTNLLRTTIPNILNSVNTNTNNNNSITNINSPSLISMQSAATAALTTTRMRSSGRFSAKFLEDNIREESEIAVIENDELIKQTSENVISEMIPPPRLSVQSPSTKRLSSPRLSNRINSSRTTLSYIEQKRDYRLSDLVLLGPEYFAHIFNLPRSTRYAPVTPATMLEKITSRPLSEYTSSSKSIIKRKVQNVVQNKSENITELDRIKQDLYHRYLWTLKPNVSCRIRPLSTYSRNTTFVI
ncbi:unnamed protein product [Didymodactylos carnosus]|uniref:Uncharacterized protein n=1 Tax=Didymodactylos carnosus TaxID=1234261 RepID=A0A814M0P7_9BILA|nr:unnamed protein product [Didymodactylos carnosus]CAF1072251.1 unnamed protein product [Didymodactylos carnosus]CAF3571660.1 unnamed protein product [Didymodactylos carnosus]CAF3839239.1 unnamed protein product [Didymodactylos carnosus]